jgi:hypothetical protein
MEIEKGSIQHSALNFSAPTSKLGAFLSAPVGAFIMQRFNEAPSSPQ